MQDIKTYSDEQLQAELTRLNTLLARKRHGPANLTVRKDAVEAEIAARAE